MHLPIDLDTLEARYVPCAPHEDHIGFATVSWWLTTHDGTRVPMTLRQPVLLHRGVFRYEQIQHLPEEVVVAMADAYATWARQQGEG